MYEISSDLPRYFKQNHKILYEQSHFMKKYFQHQTVIGNQHKTNYIRY
jgi:hypothetical protein